MKNITIFGKGNMAKVIAERFTQAGNTVEMFGSKDPVGKIGDIVVLAVPYAAVASILEANKVELKGKDLSDDEIVQAMIQFPILIERPIVVFENTAIVARPSEKLNEFI